MGSMSNAELQIQLRAYRDRLQKVEAIVASVRQMEDRLEALESEVAGLKENPVHRVYARRRLDAKGEAILDLLKSMPGIKLSPPAVAANIEGMLQNEAQSRLPAMVRNGYIQSEMPPGGSRPLYFWSATEGM